MDNTAQGTALVDQASSRVMSTPRVLRIAAVMLFAAAWVITPPSEAFAASVEAKVKSAYLYNLLRRTAWPDSTFENDESPYRIAVLGQDNLEGLLEKIAEMKKVNKRAIKLERLKSIDDYKPCHMLYVPGYALTTEQQRAIVEKTAGTPCLVVGDSPGFAQAGATANFVDREDGTIGLELNLAMAKKHRLSFDKQLLDVAQIAAQ